jgi:hypothetical protein
MNRCLFLTLLLVAGVLSCCAQIQVSQEPRHHNVLENDWVRILDVHIPPGDTSLMHQHSTPSVFLVLSKTRTGSQVLVEPAKTNFSDGNIWFEGFYDKPRIHRVWNSDTTEFHVVDMEILHKLPGLIDPPLDSVSFKILFDEKPVRGYRLTLTARGTVHVQGKKAPIVVVGLTNAAGKERVNETRMVKRGDYVFVEAGKDIDFVNKGDGIESMAVFELK